MELLLKSVDDTAALGKKLALFAEAGMSIVFTGDIASGKTTLIKAILDSLEYGGSVTSPTYTLTNVYDCKDFKVIHSDFYRLKTYHEVYGLGLDFYIDDSLNLVEWGEKFIDYFDEYLLIKMGFGQVHNDYRTIFFDTSHLGEIFKKKFNAIFKQK